MSTTFRPRHRHPKIRGLGVHKDDAFAQLIFRTWIGPMPTDDDMKTGLMGGVCD
jgi:hypothetical protein